ncbi:MAG: 2OG-Fe(II) oxygenase family protein [Verrucomicrobiae bacterium]|nr:2OG-Fe(II) oxygenase family protein [Verrucomicrobiae bacterium]
MDKQIIPAYPSLIGRFRIPNAEEVNRELRALILAREKSEPNVQHANVGGWHSGPDLLEGSHASVVALKNWIVEAVQHMIGTTLEHLRAGGLNRSFNGTLQIYGWANVARNGNYHSLHNHPRSCWSGVYYVDTGDPSNAQHPNSGVIDLHDPRPFTEMTFVPGEPYGQKYSIRPDPGTMLVFPGFLYHFVHPFFGKGERISIAFNTRAERKK